MGPIDYSLNVANPLQMALQGYQVGQQMQQQRLQQQAAERERERAMQKQQVQSELVGNPNATFADYRRAMQMFPEETKGLTEQWTAMDKVNRDLMFNAGGEAFSLLTPGQDGQIDATKAVGKLEEFALASENSGDKEGAKKFRDMAQFVKANPTAGKATIGSVLSVWDADRAKKLMEMTGGTTAADLDKDYALNVQLYGKATADNLRLAKEAAGGVIAVTGPAGTTYVNALDVAKLPGQATATPGPAPRIEGQEPITFQMYQDAKKGLGPMKSTDWLKSNGIPVRVATKQQAMSLDPGVRYITPDGKEFVR